MKNLKKDNMAQEEKQIKKKKSKTADGYNSDEDTEEEKENDGVKKTVKRIIRDIWEQ
jgi:hypothetical protein